jgi:ribosomal protein L5
MVSSSYEADRFSKNILKSYNKYETIATFFLKKNTNIAAGVTVRIEDMYSFNGLYIIDRVYQDLIQGKTKVKARKVLEGF